MTYPKTMANDSYFRFDDDSKMVNSIGVTIVFQTMEEIWYEYGKQPRSVMQIEIIYANAIMDCYPRVQSQMCCLPLYRWLFEAADKPHPHHTTPMNFRILDM